MSETKVAGRFAKRIVVDPSGCWNWAGTRSSRGYGRISVGRRARQAHRVIYEMIVGPIPDGLTLDHLCRNRLCVNPDHLEPVSNRENVLRGVGPSARAFRATHRPKGHPYSEGNTTRRQGYRRCKQCDKEYHAERYSDPEIRARLVEAQRAYRARGN